MLVAVEGIDGAGKRTFTRELIRVAEAGGYSASGMSFPRYGRTALSSLIGSYLALRHGSDLEPKPLAAVFAAERLESLPELSESIARDQVVVLDRYVASNMAYQAAKLPRAERADFVNWIAALEFETFALPKPQLTVLLALSVETAIQRVTSRPSVDGRIDVDRHERDADLMEECDRVYRWLAETDPHSKWVIIEDNDLARSPAELANHVWDQHCRSFVERDILMRTGGNSND